MRRGRGVGSLLGRIVRVLIPNASSPSQTGEVGREGRRDNSGSLSWIWASLRRQLE